MMRYSSRLISDPVVRQNPVTVQILGVCSALAVTRTLIPAIIMSITLTLILVMSNVIVSALRHQLPHSVRLILEMLIIATGVTIADEFLKAYVPDIAATLSVFVGLIITNCIVLGRAEAFAMNNPVIPSAMDALGQGLGYSLILVLVASIRELFGTGRLLDYQIFELVSDNGWFSPLLIMSLPASAFFIVAGLIWLSRGNSAQPVLTQWQFEPHVYRGKI
jgi:Na+-transporting NADH:ubiquinone oxidoreductase subunit D